MNSAPRPASFIRLLITLVSLTAGLGAFGQGSNFSKKVLHTDGTTTESISDLAKGELKETTFDQRGMVLSKRIVLLNEVGQPAQGMIYAGNDALVGKVEFYYDEFGRLYEERSLNAQGQVFRQKCQFYDQSGKPLSSKIQDYPEYAPKIASNSINFTNTIKMPGVRGNPAPTGDPQQPKQPGEAPQIERVSPQNKPAEKKKGFFQKIFNK